MGTSLTTIGISHPWGEIHQWSHEDLGEFIVGPYVFAICVCAQDMTTIYSRLAKIKSKSGSLGYQKLKARAHTALGHPQHSKHLDCCIGMID